MDGDGQRWTEIRQLARLRAARQLVASDESLGHADLYGGIVFDRKVSTSYYDMGVGRGGVDPRLEVTDGDANAESCCRRPVVVERVSPSAQDNAADAAIGAIVADQVVAWNAGDGAPTPGSLADVSFTNLSAW